MGWAFPDNKWAFPEAHSLRWPSKRAHFLRHLIFGLYRYHVYFITFIDGRSRVSETRRKRAFFVVVTVAFFVHSSCIQLDLLEFSEFLSRIMIKYSP